MHLVHVPKQHYHSKQCLSFKKLQPHKIILMIWTIALTCKCYRFKEDFSQFIVLCSSTVLLDGYVVVQFGFWFNLDFPLFFSMLIYDNEYQTKENPNWTKNQIELQQLLCYLLQVDIRIQDEDLRCRKFFHPVSYSRVIRECEARMVEEYIPYLQGECRQMVKEENRPGKYRQKLVCRESLCFFLFSRIRINFFLYGAIDPWVLGIVQSKSL